MRAASHARRVPLGTLLLMLVLALAGCTTDDGTTDPDPTDGPAAGDTTGPGTGPGSGTGTGDDDAASSTGHVAVYLKDAPEDTFAEVHIIVTGVEVHLVATEDDDGTATPTTTTKTDGTTNTTTTGSTTNTTTTGSTNTTTTSTTSTTTTGPTGPTAGCDGWVFVAQERLDIDLLATQGDLAAFLGTGEVPTCRVTQIRLHTQEAYGITHEGENVTIRLANDELRIVRSFVVAGDATTHVVIDIDLERSLREQGNQGWRLTPVIGRAYATVAPAPDAEGGQIVIAPQE